jgi:endonuclease YncB( thermonuclease family)
MDKLKPYTYYAIITSEHDGDTFTANVRLGMGMVREYQSVRLNGCNAIELNQPGGKETRDHLASILPIGSLVMLDSVAFDKYSGRIDANVWYLDHDGNPLPNGNLVEILIADGWLARWDGKARKPVPAWPRIPPAFPLPA